MDIRLQFRDESLTSTDFPNILTRIHHVTNAMTRIDARFADWYAQGDSPEEAHMYRAFENGQPSAALVAVLRHRYANDSMFTSVALWDGDEDHNEGATLACLVGDKYLPDSFVVSLYNDAAFGDVNSMASVVLAAIGAFAPAYLAVAPRAYAGKQVFDDKPGVGWMLYLPTIITTQQVPEARALIPIRATGKQQTGTIIVSVTDTVFSIDNPEHIEIANRIEIRLVDQDLLPRYVDL
ncbi:immunity 52 family protein [Paraburkholderia sp. BL21I4N1]|uniref:immunity 52 family protein n=1 Tax=Paraburkholderia sp. BL21I4N1 TaxID=1938801 RepID=UPI000CFCC3DB|nr:immunity 52 family protein [Paraburkholderia sp. BL21I4N1]PQV51054.1 immunity protein 52 of polymorphic toxin system [Paraburkholderia sp. BL21I4N1]